MRSAYDSPSQASTSQPDSVKRWMFSSEASRVAMTNSGAVSIEWISFESKVNDAEESNTIRVATRGPPGRAVSVGSSGAGGSTANDNRVDAASDLMNDCARCFVRDPLAVACFSRDLSVECHRPLRDHPRRSRFEQLQVGSIQFAGFLLAYTDFNFNARFPQDSYPAAIDLWKWISLCDDDAFDPRLNNRVGTGGRLALVAARLERHKHCCAASRLACLVQGFHFCMRAAEPLVPTFTNDLAISHDQTSHHWVRFNEAFALFSECDRPHHEVSRLRGRHSYLSRIYIRSFNRSPISGVLIEADGRQSMPLATD